MPRRLSPPFPAELPGNAPSEGGGSSGAAVDVVAGTAPIVITGTASHPDVTITAATDGAAGSMSAADKTKLDGITSGANPSVFISSQFAQAVTQAVPSGFTFVSVIGGNQNVTIPTNGGRIILLGSVWDAQSASTVDEAVATVFVDNVEGGGLGPKDLPFGTTLPTAGSVAVNWITAPLAAGLHTVDLRVASTTVAGHASGDLVIMVVTA